MTRGQIVGKHLGKRAPSNKPALMLADFLTGIMPVIPMSADHFSGQPSWELGRNNQFGTCGPVSVANSRRLVTYGLTGATDIVTFDDIADLYRRSGNPGFDPTLPANDPKQDDNGVDMQTMLGALLKGGIGGRKPLAFAKIAAGDMDTMDRAIALFGSVNIGLSLKVAQQSQGKTWSYVSGSGDWGGHAVLAGRYIDQAGTSADRTGIITWATLVDMDRDFVTKQQDECWVIIWPEHLSSKTFLTGVDVSALGSAYQELTGRPFPGAVPAPAPTPAPAPVPAPTPTDGSDAALAGALRRLLTHKGVPRYLRTAAEPWVAQH